MTLKGRCLPLVVIAVVTISCSAQVEPASEVSGSSSFLRASRRSDNNEQVPGKQRKLRTAPTDAFTIVFVSDMENLFRNHSPERCRYVLEYIRDIVQENRFYDAPYSDQVIDPQLIIHGGDSSNRLGCTNDETANCRSADEEWNAVWNASFETEKPIPLISGLGNWDWQTAAGTGDISSSVWGYTDKERTNITDFINSQAQEIVSRTYQESAKLGVAYQEFKPQGIGPSFYRATFRGVQIANFNIASYWESYDDKGVYGTGAMFKSLADSLDRKQTTIFFEHYPIYELPFFPLLKTLFLIFQFRKTVHMSGHIHEPFFIPLLFFRDYVAPYPHSWEGKRPAFYSMLVSASKGILQVKWTAIPGLPDGSPCDIEDTCKLCDSGARVLDGEYQCGSPQPAAYDGLAT